MQTEEEKPFPPAGTSNQESMSQPRQEGPCSPPIKCQHIPPPATAAAWGRLAQAPTPPGKRGAEEFASGEQRQVSVQILGRPGRVGARCQAPPKMQSQGPTPGREDRVRAAKGSPYVRGGAGSRPPPAFHPAAGGPPLPVLA